MTNIGGELIGSFMPGGGGEEEEAASKYAHGQSQALIKQTYSGFGQAQAWIEQTYSGLGQAQAQIKQTYYQHGQTQALIGTINLVFAQAQANILQIYYGLGQSQADILQTYVQHGQANAYIVRTGFGLGQAQATIRGNAFGQAQADILQTYIQHAQSQALIKNTYQGYGQAQATVKATVSQHGQANALLVGAIQVFGQAQATIAAVTSSHGNANALILSGLEVILRDTFTRIGAVGDEGTPDIGSYHAANSGLGPGFTNGTRVEVPANLGSAYLENSAELQDLETYFEFEAGTGHNISHYLRVASTPFTFAAYMEVQFFHSGTSSNSISLSWEDGFDSYSVSYEFLYIAGIQYGVRTRFIGSNIKVKIWPLSSPEPDEWFIDEVSVTFPKKGFTGLQFAGFPAGQTLFIDNYNIGTYRPKGFGQAQAYIDQSAPYKFGQAQAQITNKQGFGQAQGRIIKLTDHIEDAETYIFEKGTTRTFFNDLSVFTQEIDDPSPYDGATPPNGGWIGDFVDEDGDIAPNGWLYFTLPAASLVDIDTFTHGGSINDTIIVLYSATSGYENGWTRLSFNDDVSGSARESRLLTSLPADTYLLFVGEYSYTNMNDTLVTIFVQEPPTQGFGQARATIKGVVRRHGLARAKILVSSQKFGQAQAFIGSFKHGQAQAYIKTDLAFAYAQAFIHRSEGYGNALAIIVVRDIEGLGQSRAVVIRVTRANGQAQARIFSFPTPVAQAQALIVRTDGYGQAKALIVTSVFKFAQARAIIRPSMGTGQAKAIIRVTFTDIHGYARAFIGNRRGLGQAAARIIGNERRNHGQAQASVVNTRWPFGQARAMIAKNAGFGQAAAKINALGQRVYGNAQARIFAVVITPKCGQAQGYIKGPATGQAQALIYSVSFLVKHNGYNFPGYAQAESLESIARIESPTIVYIDGQPSEYVGLQNKNISVRMLVTGTTYGEVKQQVQRAATILFSSREFSKLYLGHTDKYYTALGKNITTEKQVTESMRLLGYTLTFEAKPWLTSDTEFSAAGSGLITIARTPYDGGWTIASVTGTNVTVSGYTDTEIMTDFQTIDGTGEIRIGPETNYIETDGPITIRYRNRWYL